MSSYFDLISSRSFENNILLKIGKFEINISIKGVTKSTEMNINLLYVEGQSENKMKSLTYVSRMVPASCLAGVRVGHVISSTYGQKWRLATEACPASFVVIAAVVRK